MGEITDPESRHGLPYPLSSEPWGREGLGTKPDWLCFAYKCDLPIEIVLWWTGCAMRKHGYCWSHAVKIGAATGGQLLGRVS